MQLSKTAPSLHALLLASLLLGGTAACGDDAQAPADVEPPEIEDVTRERGGASSGEYGVLEEPEPAPDFMLKTLSGEPFHLAEHRGEVVLLNFWATWCAPCRVEIPDFIELQEEYGDEGLQIVGVSVDAEGFEAVRPFAEEVGFNYPIVVDIGEVSEMYGGVYALPTTIIIDREGRIVRKVAGMMTRKDLEPIVKELLEA